MLLIWIVWVGWCGCCAQHLVVKFGSFMKMKRRPLFDENNNSDAGVGDDADEDFELPPVSHSLCSDIMYLGV